MGGTSSVRCGIDIGSDDAETRYQNSSPTGSDQSLSDKAVEKLCKNDKTSMILTLPMDRSIDKLQIDELDRSLSPDSGRSNYGDQKSSDHHRIGNHDHKRNPRRKNSLQIYRAEQSNKTYKSLSKHSIKSHSSENSIMSLDSSGYGSSTKLGSDTATPNTSIDTVSTSSSNSFNLKYEKGVPSVLHAARENHLPTVMYIFEKFPKAYQLEAKDSDGWTPLLWALSHGNVPLVGLLVGKGANVKVREIREDFTALHIAVNTGILPSVILLLRKGADMSMVDKRGRTSLHIACSLGFLSIVEYLVNNGANIEIRNKQKDTPLLSAAINGHMSIVSFLLSKGAHVAVKLDVSDVII